MSDGVRAELLRLLEKHQWAGVAEGFENSRASRCPECYGIRYGEYIHLGCGEYEVGEGHKPECPIAYALGKWK